MGARKQRTDRQAMRPAVWVARWLTATEVAYTQGRITLRQLEGARAKAALLRGARAAAAPGSGRQGRPRPRRRGGNA